MDTSETYIKMRKKATNYLGMGIPPKYAMGGSGRVGSVWYTDNVHVDIKGDFYYSTATEAVHLPRQDQLQDMVGLPLTGLMSFFWGFNLSEESSKFASMEQLWLAFVMKERYGKIWNGEDWVK